MRGSSGGGIALPSTFTPPPELAGAKAVIFSSVPMSPALDPPTGLHLSFSTDDGAKLARFGRNRPRTGLN